MKGFKSLAAAVLLSLVVCVPQVFAEEDQKCPLHEKKWEQAHAKRIERLAQKLELTDAQKEKIEAIMKEGKEKVQTEMKKVKELTRDIKKETDKKILSVLNAKQKKKYEEMKKKMGDKRKKGAKKGMKKRAGKRCDDHEKECEHEGDEAE